MIERVNGELANVLGNLVQRTISMGNKYFDGKVQNKNVKEEVDEQFIKSISDLDSLVTAKIGKYQISDARAEIFNVLRASNKYIDDTTPWILAKDENSRDRLETVIYNLLESIRVCGKLLLAFMPETSEKIATQLNNTNDSLSFVSDNVYELSTPEALFQRIDKEKFLV